MAHGNKCGGGGLCVGEDDERGWWQLKLGDSKGASRLSVDEEKFKRS